MMALYAAQLQQRERDSLPLTRIVPAIKPSEQSNQMHSVGMLERQNQSLHVHLMPTPAA
jgi:hypothetical protein